MSSFSKTAVRVRILCRKPPSRFKGQPTEFGLLDKQRDLHSGKVARDEILAFTIDLPVVKNPKTKGCRFQGPFVHNGPRSTQHLYLGWRFVGDSAWINRLKVVLGMSHGQVEEAAGGPGVLEADATAPQWGVLADWHGLDAGRDWKLKTR